MKKFILIFLVFLLSCNVYVVKNIYQKTYPISDSTVFVQDIYTQCKKYNADSIPLNQWLDNKFLSGDSVIIEQKMLRKIIDDKTSYTFICTKYSLGIPYYQFTIRYKGKSK